MHSDLGFKKFSRGKKNPGHPLLRGPLRGGRGVEKEGELEGREGDVEGPGN